ncbi:FAD-dependent monooxygenase [Actinoplanes sichuanensis]|uniref:FAD-dependent monooxygenase n=1 Tax=Actinoplanes sichuanensis TaxID=512349 RepID=A0ABW4A5P4_9ACTN|nr:FAD-dependent monooxygenase [Actinoplanes sichuanensis]BEL05169.1 FAD-dependent monooxygenase [Actinoplanes sichuanensis]
MTVRIAILGGGIGGLATSAFLRRAGIRSVVYEQAAALTQVGAGLLVTPNAARLLRRLGVFEELSESALRLEVGWEFRRWRDGTVLSSEDLSTACADLYGEHTWTIHRADLLRALLSRVDRVELGRRCVAVDGGRLRFADGSTVEADVVIGADGIHSIVRGSMFGVTPAAYSGMCAFRALVPSQSAPEFARRPAQTLWIGPGRHLVHYPVAAGRLVNLVAVAPAGDHTVESWTATATVGELRAEFDGWDPRLTGLIESATTLGRWALLSRPPLPRWSEGATTLLGDAAHPMFPFYAQGAAQAIEDAAVLARCLARTADPQAAVRDYESLRLPRTTRLQQVSHARAESNHLPDGPAQRERDETFAQRDPLVANGWIYGYDPEAP